MRAAIQAFRRLPVEGSDLFCDFAIVTLCVGRLFSKIFTKVKYN